MDFDLQKTVRICIISGIILSSLLLSYINSGLLIPIQRSKNMAYGQDESITSYIKPIVATIKESDNSSRNFTIQIPNMAKGPAINPAKGYLVQEIRDHLYWVTDGSCNTMFLVTDKGVIVVDAPPTIGKNYLKAISEVTNKPINYVIYSHAHLDHIGAANMFPKNATFIAQEDTAAELQKARSATTNASFLPPLPTVIFSKNYTLQIGNQRLQLDYYGNNHLPGNIFIYAPHQKLLMLVDVIFPGWIPFPYLAVANDVTGFIKAHDIALNRYDFDTFVGGHLTRLGTRDDVKVQKEFVSDLESAASKANHDVYFVTIAKQIGHFEIPWLLYSKFTDAVNQKCVDSMLPKWESKLGGADQFTSTHCFTMSEALRVDPTVAAITQNSTSANN